MRAAFDTSPASLDRLLAVSLERIRLLNRPRSESIRGCSFKEAVMLLRLLVEPFCGSGNGGCAMRLAVQRSTLS